MPMYISHSNVERRGDSVTTKCWNKSICDALQENRELVTQAYFEIWKIEVGMVKNNSSVDFEIFFTYLNMFSITSM